MKSSGPIIEMYEKFVMPTYIRVPVVFKEGDGITIKDTGGKEYLDFFPGWAVSGIGHCHKRVVAAIQKQAGRLIHVSNNYHNELQAALARKIIAHSFPGKVFFSNSGAEANECAFKLARKYGNPRGRYEIIGMKGSFHGRTLATLTATGQDKVKQGFDPLPEGFRSVPFNDIQSLRSALSERTAAVIVEPIQGEGGINVSGKSYIKEMRQLCDRHDVLLIFDEIQTGMGRTGEMFCFKHYGVEPDVMTLAKSLGSGVPVGATVASERIADTLTPGSHASTFGGGPLVCAAALATFEAIEEENLLSNARNMGSHLKSTLLDLKKSFRCIKDIKGMGLMLGIELAIDGTPIYEECFRRGLLVNCTQGNIIRIMPPLTVSEDDIRRAAEVLNEVFSHN